MDQRREFQAARFDRETKTEHRPAGKLEWWTYAGMLGRSHGAREADGLAVELDLGRGWHNPVKRLNAMAPHSIGKQEVSICLLGALLVDVY